MLKNETIPVPLYYQSNIMRSLEISFISCKVELKLRWTKHSVLSVLNIENNDANTYSNNVIFTIKDKNLYVLIVN